jgi:zinc protease
MGGRLFTEIRDRRGLGYALTSINVEGIEPGYFCIYMAVDPERLNESVDSSLSVLKQIKDEAMDEEELRRLKNYLIGTFEIALQRFRSRATLMAFDELYGDGFDAFLSYPEKILAVKEKDILDVANRYFKLDSYVLAIVGPKGEEFLKSH